MRSLIDILNTGDLKYLLYHHEDEFFVPEFDLMQDLVRVFDAIMTEYQELTGTNQYQEHFDKVDHALYEQYQIRVLNLMGQCIMLCLHNEFNELNDKFGFKIKLDITKITDNIALQRIETKIKSIVSRIKVRNLKKDEQKQEQPTWEEIRVGIHRVLNILPEYDCTVSQCVAYEREAKRVEDLKKVKADG